MLLMPQIITSFSRITVFQWESVRSGAHSILNVARIVKENSSVM